MSRLKQNNLCSEMQDVTHEACELPKIDFTISLDNFLEAMKAGTVFYNGKKVNSLNHLKILSDRKKAREGKKN